MIQWIHKEMIRTYLKLDHGENYTFRDIKNFFLRHNVTSVGCNVYTITL